MPELKRNFFSGYFYADPTNPRLFHGAEIYHAVDCGRFDDNGTERALMHYTLCKDDLPDTRGRNCEMCDFSLFDSDLDNQPIMQALMTDPVAALELVHPIVAQLLQQDFENGVSAFEIAESRSGVLVPEFIGFTLDQVLQYKPDIWQPSLDEEGNEIPNVNRCSLEHE